MLHLRCRQCLPICCVVKCCAHQARSLCRLQLLCVEQKAYLLSELRRKEVELLEVACAAHIVDCSCNGVQWSTRREIAQQLGRYLREGLRRERLFAQQRSSWLALCCAVRAVNDAAQTNCHLLYWRQASNRAKTTMALGACRARGEAAP